MPDAPGTFGIAIRPTLLFVVAFALNVTPHEAAHAAVAYFLGFSSTLFQMWVNPDAATATSRQLAVIAASGPIFSLGVGVITWLLYKERYKGRPSGLVFLMLAVIGIYCFLGPVAVAALGGDFNTALKFMGASKIIQDALSATGLVLLPLFMFFMGRELSWLIGTLFIPLIYWPLPKFLVGSTLISSVFWVFAVLGATFASSRSRPAHPVPSVTRLDLIVMIFALIMVRVLAHGIRLAR
jgi:hypothetical protein